MLGIELLNTSFDLVNEALDVAFLWGGIILLLIAYPTYFFATNLKKYAKENRGQELVTQSFLAVLIGTAIAFVWALADLVWFVFLSGPTSPAEAALAWGGLSKNFSFIRWVLLLGAFFASAYVWGHEHGKKRWLVSAIGHIAVIAIGWVNNYWIGIIFISIPVIATYYGALYSLATVILPASDPEDRVEKKKKFFVLASYTWGTQSPITVVDGHAWKKNSPRIPGDITWEFAEYPIPFFNKVLRNGVVWTRSHQAVAISGGTKFKRVDGPGIVFPGKLERPDQVFDLRLQLRTREIEVVSKDSIRFHVRYFTAFRIDNLEWSKDLYETLRRMNPILRGADKLTNTTGSFPFSPQRVQAALGITSTKVEEGAPLIYWDQCVMNIIEGETRKVISQKNLDEMWRPALDTPLVNAMEIIAHEIKRNSEMILRASGILLVAARVVDFRVPTQQEHEKDNEITKQHLDTWGSEWEKRRKNILADAEAESERTQQVARANAEAQLLEAIAKGLKETQEINPELPRHVIAMRFLSSLQDYVHEDLPGEADEDEEDENGEAKRTERKEREKLMRYIRDWQDMFFANRSKGR